MLITRNIIIEDYSLGLLSEQILAEPLVKTIQRIDHGTGLVEILVEDNWAQANDDSLDLAISSHDPADVEDDLDFLIQIIVTKGVPTKPVKSINYKTELDQNIYPQRTFNNGLLTSVTYYKDIDEATGALSNPVLQVDIVYTLKEDAVHNSAKTIEKRETKRRWHLSNGNISEIGKKVTKKTYPHITESRGEGSRRRRNIFNIASKDIVVLLMFTETAGDQEAAEQIGLAIVGTYEAEFNNFTKVAAAQQLIDVITADVTYSWLDHLVPNDATVQFLVPKAIIGESIRDYINRSFSGVL